MAVTLVLPAAANRQSVLIAVVSVARVPRHRALSVAGGQAARRLLQVAALPRRPFRGRAGLLGRLRRGGGLRALRVLGRHLRVLLLPPAIRPSLHGAHQRRRISAAMLHGPEYRLIELNWVLMTGALLVVGLLVGRLRARIEVLVDQLAAAARTDPLTGLPNRRELAVRLRDEIIRYGRHPRPVQRHRARSRRAQADQRQPGPQRRRPGARQDRVGAPGPDPRRGHGGAHRRRRVRDRRSGGGCR